MPRVFLSPSVQEYNQFVNGGTEEQYMNLIADAIEPYLIASGIDFDRNSPEQTLSEVIAQSNAGDYDLHLAIHSNAGPPQLAGQLQGADVYYYANSPRGRRLAETIAANYRLLYPDPNNVEVIPTTTLRELRRTVAPAALIEVAYHDNPEDAVWIKENIDEIGKNLAKSIADYLDVPFQEASQG